MKVGGILMTLPFRGRNDVGKFPESPTDTLMQGLGGVGTSSTSIAIFCNSASYLRGKGDGWRRKMDSGNILQASHRLWSLFILSHPQALGKGCCPCCIQKQGRLDLLSLMTYWFAPSICLKFVLFVALSLPEGVKVYPKHPKP